MTNTNINTKLFTLSRDGEQIMLGTEQEVWAYLHNHTTGSVDWSLNHEGYSIDELPTSRYTLLGLNSLETIESNNTDDLKVDGWKVRVWLSRMTVEDGMEYNHQVTVEHKIDGSWETVHTYQAI